MDTGEQERAMIEYRAELAAGNISGQVICADREAERAEIVAWLRAIAAQGVPFDLDPMAALGLVLDVAAAAIERGEHVRENITPETPEA